ncbi:antibiotic biosynthesis monooxygenase [Rubripirellula amarantea]|nr:antibiotic biosynthesis monooxygenase [Rubripirellula amarantea]
MNLTKQSTGACHATIFATAFPAPGKEQQWELAIGDLIRASSTFPGHQGTTILHPESADRPHYRVITRFDTMENMRRWYHSSERQERVEKLSPFEQQPAEIQQLTGFEPWFTPPDDSSVSFDAPPKYKMFVVVWIAVYAAVLPMISVLKPAFASIPPLLSSAMLAAISVATMTWIILPLLTWVFRAWLYPKPS